jgi:hypothetical protein
MDRSCCGDLKFGETSSGLLNCSLEVDDNGSADVALVAKFVQENVMLQIAGRDIAALKKPMRESRECPPTAFILGGYP